MGNLNKFDCRLYLFQKSEKIQSPRKSAINPDYLLVAIGFTAGQLQIIDMMSQDETRRSLQKINDERTYDSGAVTAIQVKFFEMRFFRKYLIFEKEL